MREEFFGPLAWTNLAEELGKTDSKALPTGSSDALRAALRLVEGYALHIWPQAYIELAIVLQTAITWDSRHRL